MIGKHYSKEHYNCAHFVSEWYKEKLGIEIPDNDVFSLSFAKWMRSNFNQVPTPVNNALVLMKTVNGLHVGIYSDYGVYHNYQTRNKHGSVVHWDIGVINRHYQEVTYWVWSQ